MPIDIISFKMYADIVFQKHISVWISFQAINSIRDVSFLFVIFFCWENVQPKSFAGNFRIAGKNFSSGCSSVRVT